MRYDYLLRKDIFGWDVRNWSRALDLWDQVLPQSGDAELALEIGAREGGLSLYLALRGYSVICSDLENPERLARPCHERRLATANISYVAADASRLPFPDNNFSVIIFKSVLGTIGRNNRLDLQVQAVQEMYRVLKPGGVLLFAENLAGMRLHRFFRRFTRWGSYWRYVKTEEIALFCREFSRFSYKTFGYLATFGRSEFHRNLLHHVDIALDPCLKDHHKYIIFGYAQK